MSFYVILPSTAINEGAGAEYRTTLCHEIILPENDWHVALTTFQYVGQKWGLLNHRERTVGIQYYGLINKNFVMEWSHVSDFKVYVDTSVTVLPVTNYTWENLQQKNKLAFANSLATQNQIRQGQIKSIITANLDFVNDGTLRISKNALS